MSVANDSLLYNLGLQGFPVTDNQAALNANSQTTAVAVIGDAFRVTTSVANGSCVLKSSISNEASPLIFVINDSPNTIKVYPSVGETEGGAANSPLSIPAGQSGIFVRVPPQIAKGGGGNQGTGDWRVAVIP
jgi:hypothetical protein